MRNRLATKKDLHLERMFETRSEAWDKVGLAADVSQRVVRRAQREALALTPLLIAVLVVYAERKRLLHVSDNGTWITPLRIITVLVLLVLGWAIARDVGKAAAPTFFRRMDPATAGTVGFLVRLTTIGITLILALSIASVAPSAILAGSAFTAVVFGLAAQQTLGNLIAGVVLLSAQPFRVGERVRFQAGAVGGTIEGVVSTLGLLYTTLARGEDRIQVPNNVVLSAAVVPLREPDAVDVRVRLRSGVRPSHVQQILDQQIGTPTRNAARVLLQEIDGEDVQVRVQATPERAADGAKLADEIILALASVTGEHAVSAEGEQAASAEDERAASSDGEPRTVVREPRTAAAAWQQ